LQLRNPKEPLVPGGKEGWVESPPEKKRKNIELKEKMDCTQK
jgi:hypothetical protein